MGMWAGCLHQRGRGGLSLLEIWGVVYPGQMSFCCHIVYHSLYLKGGQAKRWGKMVFSFRRKEGRVFCSCVGRGRSGWRRDRKLDKEGGEVIGRWGAGTFSLTKEGVADE